MSKFPIKTKIKVGGASLFSKHVKISSKSFDAFWTISSGFYLWNLKQNMKPITLAF